MKQLFGTDGIRGKADEFPLDSETIWIIGKSLATYFLPNNGEKPRFIVGRDTRESGERIENAFASGVTAGGGSSESAGIITTPGVAYLTASNDFDAGVVISASHNPFEDNGIKLFSKTGEKLGREVEQVIEAAIHAHQTEGIEIGAIDSNRANAFREEYVEHFKHDFGNLDLSGLKIVADCANGAASGLAPRLFTGLGAEVIAINNKPDGRNINRGCGSMHLEGLSKSVIAAGADFGVAFDGDADRSLFVDDKGRVIDGDATLWIMANYLKARGKLKNDTVVATVMSNLGLEIALRNRSISLLRTAVGDKYVLRELLDSGHSIGGEQSGHIIFPSRSLVGDGMQTALFMLDALVSSKGSFSSLLDGFETYPQILVNVKVARKAPFEEIPEILNGKNRVESELGKSGRLLLRYSGTENLARVMIEGVDQTDIEIKANGLANVIEKALG